MTRSKPTLPAIDQSGIDTALALVKPSKIATPFRAIDVHPEVRNMAALRGAVEIVMNARPVKAEGVDHAAD